MNDLISRKALIAEYDRVHIGPPGGARKLIEDAPAVQRWIPVSERLPLNDTYLNVTTDGVVVPAYWHNDRFWAFTAIGVATVGGVTHWMPLPEPPKGE